MAHDGHHDIELKVAAGCTADRDCLIVSDDAGGHLHQALAHDRVHFAWHDRAAWLSIWQNDFKETAAWSRAQPTDIVGDIHECGRDGLELAMAIDQAIALRIGLEVIDSFDE